MPCVYYVTSLLEDHKCAIFVICDQQNLHTTTLWPTLCCDFNPAKCAFQQTAFFPFKISVNKSLQFSYKQKHEAKKINKIVWSQKLLLFKFEASVGGWE